MQLEPYSVVIAWIAQLRHAMRKDNRCLLPSNRRWPLGMYQVIPHECGHGLRSRWQWTSPARLAEFRIRGQVATQGFLSIGGKLAPRPRSTARSTPGRRRGRPVLQHRRVCQFNCIVTRSHNRNVPDRTNKNVHQNHDFAFKLLCRYLTTLADP